MILECWSASAKLWFRKLDWNKRPSEQSRHCCGRAMSVTLIAPVKTRARSSHLLSHFNVQCQHMGVSIDRATPKSYILIGIVHYQPSIVGYPGTPISGHPHLVFHRWLPCRPRPFLSPQRSQMRTWAVSAKDRSLKYQEKSACIKPANASKLTGYIWMPMEIPNDIRS